MKKLILMALLSLISLNVSMASDVLLPTGQFQYLKSEVTHLRDVRFFSLATEEGLQQYEQLKKIGYVCRKIPVLMSRCYKFLENNSSIEIPLQEVKALTPRFGEEYTTQVVSQSSYLVVLRVTQSVEAPYGNVTEYELHMKEGDDQFIEIIFQNESFFYQFNEDDLDTLFLRRTYRKRTGDNSYYEYGVRSIYKKI